MKRGKKPQCSNCNEEGHYKPKCPNINLNRVVATLKKLDADIINDRDAKTIAEKLRDEYHLETVEEFYYLDENDISKMPFEETQKKLLLGLLKTMKAEHDEKSRHMSMKPRNPNFFVWIL